MRVRLSVFYPLTKRELEEASAYLAQKLVKEKIEVIAFLRTDCLHVKAIVCSFEEVSESFSASPLALEFLQSHVKRAIRRWAGNGVQIILAGEKVRSVRESRLANA